MRILKFLFLAIVALLASCDSDDTQISNEAYFPLQINNRWEYEVTAEGESSIDILTVVSFSDEGYLMQAEPEIPAGIMSGVLSNALLQQVDGRLIGTGSLTFDLFGLENLDFSVTDAILYDQNASQGELLSTIDGDVTRPIQSFDLDISYTATTIQQESLETMTARGVGYDDVLHSQLIINVEIITTLSISGFDVPVTVLPAQDVFVIDNYWAKDVGLIKSINDFSYTLSDFSNFGVTLPFPQSAELTTTQELIDFNLSPDN